jgi:transcriptional regulator with XRE-family HTH domain
MMKGHKKPPSWFPTGANPKDIGLRIATLRNSHGLTQEGLADLLKSLGAAPSTSKTTVWKWENGEVENIANTTLYFLVKALHTTHQFLLFGPAGEPQPKVTYLRDRKKSR